MRSKSLFFLVVVVLLGLVTQTVLGQNNLGKVYFVKVKPGHETEFATALKAHAEWRKQAGDPWTWHVHQIVNGRNLGDFIIRSGGHSWADLDAYEEFLAKGSVEFNKNVGPHMESISSVITTTDTTNLNWVENFDEINLISLIIYEIKPGHGRAFTEAVSKYHTAIMENKRDAHYAFAWHANGNVGPRVTLALPYKNWADMAGPDESLRAFMVRVMGAEEAQKLSEQFNSTYNSAESLVLRIRRDLSVIHEM